MTYVATRIARHLGVLPRPAAPLDAMFTRLFHGGQARKAEGQTALQRMQAYVANHRGELIAIDDGRLPLSEAAFNEAAGIWDEAEKRLIVSTKHQLDGISDVEATLRELRSIGRLPAEEGILSKKAPRGICRSGRAYFVNVSE